MEKKKILIVEDEKSMSDIIHESIIEEGREIKKANNKVDAINKLKTFSPDVVLLDLGICESKDRQATSSRKNGVSVFAEIDKLNSERQGLNIQIILVTASLQEQEDCIQELIDQNKSIYDRVDKGIEDFDERLKGAVQSALKYPHPKVAVIAYKGFSPELLEELKQCNPGLYDLLQNKILINFERVNYFECIIRSGAFIKCLYDEFAFESRIEDLKSKFNKYYQEKKEDPESWNKKWWKLVKEEKVREIDKCFAVTVHFARNCPAHDGRESPDYTMDDAATVLQLLVPLIKRYIEFKKKK
jgi:CheY-like chemotaxis protein